MDRSPAADSTGHNEHADADASSDRPWWLLVLGVAVASLVLGGVTSFAQTFLPDPLRPLANSASGWTLLTAVVVWAAGPSTRVAAVLGVMSFVGLVLGYSVVSNARGYYFSPVFWSLVGVVTGPFIGVAAAWQRRGGWTRALAAATLGGVAVGEGVYGLSHVRATTGWFYWSAAIAVGLVVAVLAALRIGRPRTVLLELATLAGVALALNVAYLAVLS